MDTGVRSSLSVPLPYQDATVGALNIYSGAREAFATPESLDAGLQVAEAVAVAVVNADAHAQLAEHARNMRLAMDSRAVIEQAKGVLMAQRHIDADQAFDILRDASQRYNRKLRDISEGIVASTQEEPPALTSREASRSTRKATAAALSTVSATSTARRGGGDRAAVHERLPAPGAQPGVDDDVAAHGPQRAGHDRLGDGQRVVHDDPVGAVAVAGGVHVLREDRGGGGPDRPGGGEAGDAGLAEHRGQGDVQPDHHRAQR